MIPAAIARSLRTPAFTPDAFAPTKFHTAEDKARFGNALLKFVAGGFQRNSFSTPLYRRLSNCFGHIAHYNSAGFYDYFFTTLDGHIDFLATTLQWPCYGDPHYTHCDVERAIQARIAATNLLPLLRTRRNAEIADAERALLARLKAKYEPQPHTPDAPPAVTRQATLFDLTA